MHTLTFLFPDSLAERASCGSWLHNHANTTHLEPNKVSLSQTTHTLNSCTMYFPKTTHQNVIPGQQLLTNTLITWQEMWASHIHNIPLPQHDASIEIKTKTESSWWHQSTQSYGLELQEYVTGDKEVPGDFRWSRFAKQLYVCGFRKAVTRREICGLQDWANMAAPTFIYA